MKLSLCQLFSVYYQAFYTMTALNVCDKSFIASGGAINDSKSISYINDMQPVAPTQATMSHSFYLTSSIYDNMIKATNQNSRARMGKWQIKKWFFIPLRPDPGAPERESIFRRKKYPSKNTTWPRTGTPPETW
jgi:hypothetical protein